MIKNKDGVVPKESLILAPYHEMVSSMDVEKIFERAANHARTFKNISEKQMLQLYGLYKHAKEGPCNTPKPHIWDFIGKAKWESWNNLRDSSQINAKEEYISLVKDIDPAWDATSASPAAGGSAGLGVAVSTMCRDPDDAINECEKTVFDWCQEGDVRKLKYVITKDNSVIHMRDDEGLTLLHWAVDHGFRDIVMLLLEAGCNMNSQDSELQTPLHYAVSCGHSDLVELLIQRGADTSLKDSDGNAASVYCETDTMRKFFVKS